MIKILQKLRTEEGPASVFDLHQEEIHRKRPLPSEATTVIIGPGEFGTAIGHRIARNQFHPKLPKELRDSKNVGLYARSQSRVEEINNDHTNRDYLGSAKLNSALRAYSDIEQALEGRTHVLVAIPSDQLHAFLVETLAPTVSKLIQEQRLPGNVAFSSLIKGIPAITGSAGETIFASDLIKYVLENEGVLVGGADGVQINCMHGSGYGKQIVNKATYSLSIGTDDVSGELRAEQLRRLMLKDNSKIDLVIGGRRRVELGAVGKNYVALACNFVKGFLATRNMSDDNAFEMAYYHACQEVAQIADALSIDNPWTLVPQSMDLRLTTYNDRSRNSSAGYLIGKGYSIEEARDEMAKRLLNRTGREVEEGKTLADYRPTVEGLSVISELYALAQKLDISDALPFLTSMASLLEYRQNYPSSDLNHLDQEVFKAATCTWRDTLVTTYQSAANF